MNIKFNPITGAFNVVQSLKNYIKKSEKGAVMGVAPLGSNAKLPEQYLPDNISVNSILITQGTTSEINSSSPAPNRLFHDTSKNRFRMGNDDYAKLSEVNSSKLDIDFTGTPFTFFLFKLLTAFIATKSSGSNPITGIGLYNLDSSVYSEPSSYTSGIETLALNNVFSIEKNFLGSSIGGMNKLVSISLPSLKYVGFDFLGDSDTFTSFGMPLLSQISVPELEYIGNYLIMEGTSLPSLINLSLPKLKLTNSVIIISSNLTTLDLPELQETIGFSVEFKAISFSLPSLLRCLNHFTCVNPFLQNFSFNPNLKRMDNYITFTGCALNVASVNNILVSLANLNGQNGTTLFSGGTRRVYLAGGTNAAPTGAGLTAKATLQTRGVQVFTN